MPEGTIINHTHDNGRMCMLSADRKKWIIWKPEGNTTNLHDMECRMDHPLPRRFDLGADAGEFGMPIVGADIPEDSIPPWTLGPGMLVPSDAAWALRINVEPASEDARYILEILPDILDRFLEKNRKYKEVEKGYDLGDKGIIPDINRKVGILVSRIWHGEPAGSGEPTEEVVEDLIGHLLLMLAKRRHE